VLIAAAAPVGSRLVDSVHLVTAGEAVALKAAGADGVGQYLGSVTAAGVQAITDAGLGFVPYTYADAWDGPKTVAELVALGVPKGVVVVLDVEGLAATLGAAYVIGRINAWAEALSAAAFVPALYVGAGCLLSSDELEALAVFRYGKGMSRLVDRNGELAEPSSGWAFVQAYPSGQCGGVLVDFNIVGTDYKRRPLIWSVTEREAPTLPGRKSSGTMPALGSRPTDPSPK